MLNEKIGKATKIRNEILERYHSLEVEQRALKKRAKSYWTASAVPKELRLNIFEHRILLRTYRNWIKNINDELRLLGQLQSIEDKHNEKIHSHNEHLG